MGVGVFKTVDGYFKSLNRTMMSLGFCNSHKVYYLIFSLKFLNSSLASLYLSVVPNIALKMSISLFKFFIDNVYDWLLKRPPRLPRPW